MTVHIDESHPSTAKIEAHSAKIVGEVKDFKSASPLIVQPTRLQGSNCRQLSPSAPVALEGSFELTVNPDEYGVSLHNPDWRWTGEALLRKSKPARAARSPSSSPMTGPYRHCRVSVCFESASMAQASASTWSKADRCAERSFRDHRL
jgi:hypothetical protein